MLRRIDYPSVPASLRTGSTIVMSPKSNARGVRCLDTLAPLLRAGLVLVQRAVIALEVAECLIVPFHPANDSSLDDGDDAEAERAAE